MYRVREWIETLFVAMEGEGFVRLRAPNQLKRQELSVRPVARIGNKSSYVIFFSAFLLNTYITLLNS
jgi:hypothetical protein